MASSPGHPILKKTVSSVAKSLQALGEDNQTTIGKLNPSDEEVISVTGPLIWTQAVFDSLCEATSIEISHVNIPA